MENETDKTISQQYSIDAGLNVSGKYGLTTINSSLGFSLSNSSTDSTRNATKFSKEVVEKSSKKVSQRIKTTHTTTIIEEFEETDVHSITNDTADHKVGIYRWIDKYMKARLVNYGTRTFIEFTVPEPGAYHLYCKSDANNVTLQQIQKPIAPGDAGIPTLLGIPALKSAADITEGNYRIWAAQYGALDIEPLKPSVINLSDKISIPDSGSNKFDAMFYVQSKDIVIPEGYVATVCALLIDHGNWTQDVVSLSYLHEDTGQGTDDKLWIDYGKSEMFVVLARTVSRKSQTGLLPLVNLSTTSPDVNGNTADGISATFSINAKSVYPVLCSITLVCNRTIAEFQKWQVDCYNKIMTAYNKLLSDYNAAVSQVKNDFNYISGDNPDINRQVEQRELKRGCLEQLINIRTGAPFNPYTGWSNYGALNDGVLCTTLKDTYPFVDTCGAINQGSDVMFFEQAFEWEYINYIFYDYFWGRACSWRKLYNTEDTDPLFTKFLQAGMARVVVPIRPGFDAAVLSFLKTGIIWNGQGTPVIGDPMFVDISDEIARSLDYDLGAIADTDDRVKAIWEYKLPTTLVLLQHYAQPADDNGLPCYESPTED